jgi:hypothetical protein
MALGLKERYGLRTPGDPSRAQRALEIKDIQEGRWPADTNPGLPKGKEEFDAYQKFLYSTAPDLPLTVTNPAKRAIFAAGDVMREELPVWAPFLAIQSIPVVGPPLAIGFVGADVATEMTSKKGSITDRALRKIGAKKAVIDLLNPESYADYVMERRSYGYPEED